MREQKELESLSSDINPFIKSAGDKSEEIYNVGYVNRIANVLSEVIPENILEFLDKLVSTKTISTKLESDILEMANKIIESGKEKRELSVDDVEIIHSTLENLTGKNIDYKYVERLLTNIKEVK